MEDKELQEKYQDVEVRSLKSKDLLRAARLMAKFVRRMAVETKPDEKGRIALRDKINELSSDDTFADKSPAEITQMAITELGEELSPYEMIAMALEEAEDIVVPFLADICGMKEKKFENMPFDFPIYVIEKLSEEEDLPGFFTKAVRLAKKFTGTGTTGSKKN